MPRSCKSFVALSETLVTFKPTLSIFYATPSFFSLTLSLSLPSLFHSLSVSLSLSLLQFASTTTIRGWRRRRVHQVFLRQLYSRTWLLTRCTVKSCAAVVFLLYLDPIDSFPFCSGLISIWFGNELWEFAVESVFLYQPSRPGQRKKRSDSKTRKEGGARIHQVTEF